MRSLFASTAASALIAGSVLLGAAPAFAQNVDAGNPYFDHAEGNMSTNAGTVSAPSAGSYLATHHQYMQVDPRDAKANATSDADQADASNAYFNHAEGTMTGPAAVAQPSNSGQYVATYHQYIPVDPRDTKVVKNGDGSQDDNIYYYHAEGTMAHP